MQQVILVNEQDEPIGVMEKMEAHEKAVLHRAFSVFIFNKNRLMLLQQRALSKYHSPGLWTNACCSHPHPGEETKAAAERRMNEELGFVTSIEKAFDFTYKASFDNGLTEYEFDHVFVGTYDGEMNLNKEEVSDITFKTMTEIQSDLETIPHHYTEWFKIAFPLLAKWMQKDKFAHASA
ncbi:MAG: isopentenyl-diphosphate Delta-isomerase [Chitinophagaceae bacterium]|nr:isopentenyl-diphosphate Delta-isomerase [Chitinophagaceae bacterium]